MVNGIGHELIKRIIKDQKYEQVHPDNYICRDYEAKLLELSKNPEIIVLTGMRRCGKSVLLDYIRNKSAECDYYFNFEDERLIEFKASDFEILQEVFVELYGHQKHYYFDEIQNIPGWELFVRRLYNLGCKIYITGSNANLFSEELGTRLTGRYICLSVHPISFKEYITTHMPGITKNKSFSTIEIGQIKHVFSQYFAVGGIPEFIKYKQKEYMHALYDSILYRDIVARYKIGNAEVIRKLVFYLATNCSKEITYSSAKKYLGSGSITTISDYCRYLENSCLCYFLPRYHDSIKAQQQSPKKIYFNDHILAKMIGFRISEDFGRTLENIVFLELKRRGHEVYYHRETKECDFVIKSNAQVINAVQVSKSLLELETKKREFAGLVEAMSRFSLEQGLIITENEEYNEIIESSNNKYIIKVVPLWKWLIWECGSIQITV